MRSYRYLLRWPLANLRHHGAITVVGILGTALSAFVVATLLGFVGGYGRAVSEDVERLGFDVLITAKGCPYEAATLMLRGGVGLQYMPAGVVGRLEQDPDVAAVFPQLIHPVRDPSRPEALMLIKGVSPGWFEAMGLEVSGGDWFDETPDGLSGDGVVLGQEAAELEQRRAGDTTLLWDPVRTEHVETTVRAVLARSGTQIDGTVLMPLERAQARHDLSGQLTGVGVRVATDRPGAVAELVARYDAEAGLQVVSLSRVEQTLAQATDTLGDVVRLLAAILCVLSGAILVDTALIRTLSDGPRLYVLHAIGLPRWFLHAGAAIENLVIAGSGTLIGLLAAVLLGPITTGLLASYLPYAPDGDLVDLSPGLLGLLLVAALGLALLATLPALWRLRALDDPTTLQRA